MGASIAVTSNHPAAMLTMKPETPMNARIIASRDTDTSSAVPVWTARTTSAAIGSPSATTQTPMSRPRIPTDGRVGVGAALRAIAVSGRTEISATR